MSPSAAFVSAQESLLLVRTSVTVSYIRLCSGVVAASENVHIRSDNVLVEVTRSTPRVTSATSFHTVVLVLQKITHRVEASSEMGTGSASRDQ